MMNESIIIYQDQQFIKAVGSISREALIESTRANAVIQQAIDRYGGEISLVPGDYALSQPLRLADNITLRGKGRSTRLIANSETGILGEGVNGAVVSDLRLVAGDGPGSGIVLDDCGDCKVRDVLCAGFPDYGIWVRNNSFLCEIRGCSLAGNQKANIFLDHLATEITDMGEWVMTRAGTFIPNLVTNCIIFGGGKGIETRRTIVANIVACVVYQTNDIGFHIHTTSNSVLISGCRTFQITGPAVVVEDTHEFNLSSNIFCWHTNEGIVVRKSMWGTITGNEVIDSGSYHREAPDVTVKVSDLDAPPPSMHGIALHETLGYTVSGNAIFNWPVCMMGLAGVYEDSACADNNITGNNVNFFREATAHDTDRPAAVTGNHVQPDCHHWRYHAHAGEHEKIIQTYRTNLTRQFIDRMAAVPEEVG